MLAPNGLTVEANDRRIYNERERHLNGRTPPAIRTSNGLTGATPSIELLMQPRDYDTAFAYNYVHYVTSEEYETMMQEGRLVAGELYMVMN